MVMSMDTAADQAMGSPIENSALSIRHQESADEELNMDEQSKASSQTVVDVIRHQQQQQHQQQPQLSHSEHCQATQQNRSQLEHETEKKEADEMTAAMILSRESSFNDDDEGDERKLMMNVDYEANTSIAQQKQARDEQIAMKHKFDERGDLDRKDPLVARMRDIVEGNQTTNIQCEHHHHHQQQQPQPKSSSGDSLNNQASENNSKASVDSAQQKRSRQTRHCGRHHHHHRPSLGTNVSAGQIAPSGHHHHHHHHHHHRPVSHQHPQRHHHHHHHHHQQHQQQQTDSGRPQTSTGDAATTGDNYTSSQRPLNESDSCKHRAAAESSFSQKETSKQTGESKSSNSSVSSAPVDQNQLQQEVVLSIKNDSEPLNQSSEAINASSDQLKDGIEKCMHHPSCHHHHHHAHPPGTAQCPPHHHHHHHHHGRHHHHRNNKKRLVLDAGDDQAIQRVDNQSKIGEQHENIDSGERTGFDVQDKQQEEVSDMSPKDPMRRPPLQDIGSQSANLPQGSGSCCPYHEHHCATNQSRGAIVKLHPHHYHHHHHQHSDLQAKKEISTGEQHRGHHYHHHHRHHHHGQHHSKPRTRRHKSSSNTNINEQTQKEHSADFESSMIEKSNTIRDKQQHHLQQIEDVDTNKDEANNFGFDTRDHRDSNSSEREQINLENKMHLDHNDDSQRLEQTIQRSSMDKASSEVVNMEISPNNDNKQIKRSGLVDEAGDLIDSATAYSNFIASIEISSAKPTKSSTNEQLLSSSSQPSNHQQQVEESDFNAQGASGSDATKNNSVHEFTRNQEGDSMKQTSGKSDRLVEQMSRENSRKEMISGTGAGASKQQDHQQLIECSPLQQDTYQQSSQPKQIIESTVSPDRRCRLCWCCCCPCSGLSNRNNSSKSEAKQNVIEAPSSIVNKCQTMTNIPLDRIRSWAESFDRLMKCPDGRRIFQDFLRCEYSEENILFWIACEELKHEKDAKSIATKARDIYEDYISILSAKEVSLDSRVRDIINNNIKKPTSNIFDEAQLQIYTLMHRDSYPRFINSPMYKKLAQIQTSSSRKGST